MRRLPGKGLGSSHAIPQLHKGKKERLEKGPCALPHAKPGKKVNKMLRACWGNKSPGWSGTTLPLPAVEQWQGLALEKVWA